MSVWQIVIASGIAIMAPVLWAALGELVSERAGTLNVGIEGVMALGALGTALAFQRTGDPLASVAAALLVGALCGGILALLYVRLGTDQIITGIVFTAVALALGTLIAGKAIEGVPTATLGKVAIPGLSALPIVGPVVFNQNFLVYSALLAAPCIHVLMRHTWFGLHISAVGERPLVIETAGRSVQNLRTTALVIGCTFAAMGGATLVLSVASTYQPGITGGRGYVALAVVVLARWRALGVVPGALIFGLAGSLQFEAAQVPVVASVPYDIVLMLPYVLVVGALLIFRGSRYPAAVGIPHRPAGAART